MAKTKQFFKAETSISRPLEEVISEAFGRYAKYIIQDRALPDLRDGLKPVQRRILYTAYLSKLFHKNPHRKSATLVGEVMGSFHPHGDSSIYEAIVRMSQPWKSNLPLLEMHGNVGSIDGDPPAAYRYTEVRLSSVSEWLLKNLEKQTVDYIPNFDDTKQEPTILPALFFNLLVNGSSGIAAGYATNIPPFNPSELIQLLIVMLDQPNLSSEQICQILPAPDFPTKGIIEGTSGIKEAYETGRGRFFIHASYKIIEKKEINQLCFHDIPFETNKAFIIRTIDDLINKNALPDAIEVRDESDREGIAIVLDLKKNANIKTIVQYLYKNTDLRISYNINFVVIDQRKPKLLSLHKLITRFLTHLNQVIIRSFEFDVKQLKLRFEIVIGLLKAIGILDEIIITIRRSENKNDAKTKLINQFDFSGNQAEAIVQLRLYRLSSTDQSELQAEQISIEKQLKELNELLSNTTKLKQWIKNLLYIFNKEFFVPRQSKIETELLSLEINDQELIADKKLCYSWISENQIKILDWKKYELTDLKKNKLKLHETYLDFQAINNKDQLLICTNLGRFILWKVHKLELKKMNMVSQNLATLLNLDLRETIIGLHPLKYLQNYNQISLLLVTKNGLTKRIAINELIKSKSTKLSIIIKLNLYDQLVKSLLLATQEGSVLYLTNNGQINHVLSTNINKLFRHSTGQKAVKLKTGDYLVDLLEVPSDTDAVLLLQFNDGYKKIKYNQDQKLCKLASVGISVKSELDKSLIKANFFKPNDNLWLYDGKNEPNLISLTDLKFKDLKSKIELLHNFNFTKETFFAQKLCYAKHAANKEKISRLF